MAGLRSLVLFYLMTLFTLFNSSWAEKSLERIPCRPPLGNLRALDIYDKTDNNAFAVPTDHQFTKYIICSQDFGSVTEKLCIIHQFQIFRPSVVSEFVSCSLKSFLHLLQFF